MLREYYRENGKVKKRTIANLSGCTDAQINAVKFTFDNVDAINNNLISNISDAGSGVTELVRTQDNMQGVDRTIEFLKKDNRGLIFSNLVDFDMKFGHRRNTFGYKQALEEFDARLPEIFASLQDDDLLIITADHGCDPTHNGTDHTREYIPLLCYGKNLPVKNLGIRQSSADIAVTVENLLLGKESENSFF